MSGFSERLQWLEHWSGFLVPTAAATRVHLGPFFCTALHSLSSSDSVQGPFAVPPISILHQRLRQSLFVRPGTLLASSRHSSGRDSRVTEVAMSDNNRFLRRTQRKGVNEHSACKLTDPSQRLLAAANPPLGSTYDAHGPWLAKQSRHTRRLY